MTSKFPDIPKASANAFSKCARSVLQALRHEVGYFRFLQLEYLPQDKYENDSEFDRYYSFNFKL